jgi:multiple sugar transport system substrate-binding protein
MKKQTLVTAVTSLSLIAAGCSAKPANTSPPSPATNAPASSAAAANANASSGTEKVTIEYWQYQYPAKVDLMNTLIDEFQKAHPNITVKQTNFPYDQYNEKVAALVPAGKGPDIINLYYGWLPKYVASGYLQPLPKDGFSEEQIKQDFFPFVDTAKIGGSYYAIPTAVRTLALFYNKDLFVQAGLDPNKPPATWDELVEDAKKLTQRDANGQLKVEGMAWEPGAQLHHWFRDALIYQAGGRDLSEDRKKLLWNDGPAGLQAFQYFIDFAVKHKVGVKNFDTDDITAFKSGHAAINIDGSFNLSALKRDAPNLNYAVAPLPANQSKATQSSFWCNAITKGVTGAKLQASVEFLKFLTSKDVMER